jgi:hypothetical protein
MTHRERFRAVVKGEKPDYVPIFGFRGAPGMSSGCMQGTYDQLLASGMPDVGGGYRLGEFHNVEGWRRYWGTTGPLDVDFSLARGALGFKTTSRVEGGFEIIESESGEITRQVIDNDITYSMPEFVRYPVRDRPSWELFKERMTPRDMMPADEMEARSQAYDDRDMPLALGVGGPYSLIRGCMGTEGVSVAMCEDPALVHDITEWHLNGIRKHVLPLIERLKPEIVYMGEDLCFKNGMLLSPQQFHTFCGPCYGALCDCAFACGADMVAVDSDGNVTEFVTVAASYGVNAIFPCEVKAGNDLFVLRERHPDFVFFGWLEKETVNEGNEHLIEPEIVGKAPPLLALGRYFPNGDHGIQPFITYENLCRFMAILHEVCRNPEGVFPRV